MFPNRIGRVEFLFYLFFGAIALAIYAAFVGSDVDKPLQSIRGPFAALLFVVSMFILRAAVSRFHDLGWPGGSILVLFIPLLGVIAALFLLVVPGQKSANQYGEIQPCLHWLRKAVLS